jgi:hypothetical protein
VTERVVVTRIDLILGKKCLAFGSLELVRETIECVYPDVIVTVAVGVTTKLTTIETDPDSPQYAVRILPSVSSSPIRCPRARS